MFMRVKRGYLARLFWVGFFRVDFFPAGTGFANRFNASSKLMPCNRKSLGLDMNQVSGICV
jgi:hypothetical protein